jgi:glycosyltransferase involved in cell wall biosynthesis
LKILLLNYIDSGGGAAIAAKRLLNELCHNNIDAVLGVIKKKSFDNSVIVLKRHSFIEHYSFYRIIIKIFKKIIYIKNKIFKNDFKTSNKILHSTNTKTLIDINYINNSDYDLIHLHWVNCDMISIEDIAKINKPIVWTMHDCWIFCGAEHYPNILEKDIRFIEGYNKKNKPKTTLGTDICRKTWERKKKAWKNTKFNFISPSNYEKDCFVKSALLKNSQNNCTVIPNIIPENIFKPIDNKLLKELYQIPSDKKVIGFGAAGVVIEKKSIKGEYLLLDSFKKLHNKSDYQLVIFGDNNNLFLNELQISIFSTGFISNPYILAGIYNLCDVFVCPSLLENLPNVCIESIFCGVPVTAFNTGGIPDIVEHKKTGYLAQCFDSEDLYNGILYCIDNHDELSHNALLKARNDFNNKTIAQKHINLYKSIINTRI